MRAAVLTDYGPPKVLRVEEVDKPTPGPDEVLVRVHASTVTAGDTELRTMKVPWLFEIPLRLWLGLLRPRRLMIPGMEVAGVIDAVGASVARFAVGDAVFGGTGMGFGGNAEYVCVPAGGTMCIKPAALSFAAAATVPIGGLAALGYLRRGGIAQGQRVLVRGASGSIGTFAVQLAKHFGAHVTGVCGPESLERVRSLGADEVLDYTAQEWTENGELYDLIVDVVGRMSVLRCLKSLTARGSYVRCTIPGAWEVLQALWVRVASRKRVVLGDAGESIEDLAFLGGLLDEKKIETIIDRRYSLEGIVEAHRYVETGQKQGHVVVTLRPADES
ncbi:MAG: NAD(P)-dependent alcohol dehydrogenase [Deltaproteobacteria bacterium]|nr:NAD(P)-dependent alcohol dehydrogenase [Deltaproteobacteria bacterium]